jgi:hypothetical protein
MLFEEIGYHQPNKTYVFKDLLYCLLITKFIQKKRIV